MAPRTRGLTDATDEASKGQIRQANEALILAAAGRMAPVDSIHLFFTIWTATQTMRVPPSMWWR